MTAYYCGECERTFEISEEDDPICPADGTALARLSHGRTPGDVVAGRYTLEKPLGRGGMGLVFRARHQASGKPVAVKLIQRNQHKATTVKRFFREARASTRISHPGIVQVYDFGRTKDDTPYMVMELLDGTPLEEILDHTGPLEPRRAAHLGGEIASSLAATHAIGILHRDLKPSNVTVRRDDEGTERVKLLDFGLAKAVDENHEDLQTVTTSGTPIGTPRYMSPEQFRCRELRPETDLYALGGLLFQMLVGHPPFRGRNFFALMQQHVKQDPPPLAEAAPVRNVPDRLEDLCEQLLEKEIQDRPGDTADVAETLYDIADRAAPVDIPRDVDDATTEFDTPAPGEGETIEGPPGGMSPVGRQVVRPEFIGRDGTRSFLENVLEECVEDHQAALVALEGPRGVGKSALLEWLKGRAELRADRVAVGYHDVDHLGPFGAVKEVLESLLDVEGLTADELDDKLEEFVAAEDREHGLTPAERERLERFLRPELDDDRRLEVDDGERAVAYEAIIRGLRASASSEPTVVLLDDLRDSHSFDPNFVERLGTHLSEGEQPLLVVMATRTEAPPEEPEVRDDMQETMERAASSLAAQLGERFYRIEIDPLGDDEVERMLERALPGIRPEAVDRIVELAGGNPFHTLQLVRHLVAEGSLSPEGREWVLEGEVTIPEDLDALLDARLERLREREDEHALVIRAALVGERIPLDLLENTLERENNFELLDDLDLLLDRLIDDGWLRNESNWEEEAVVFEHGYVREELVERYGSRRAARSIHRAVAEAKEAFHADDLESVASEIADHFVACREYGRALPHLQSAARAAARRYAVGEAIENWERALEIGTGRRAPEDWDADTARRSLVRLLIRAGRYREADAHLDDLGSAPETLELRGDLADARAEYEEARDYYEDALESQTPDPPEPDAARIRAKLSNAYEKLSQFDDAKRLAESVRTLERPDSQLHLKGRALDRLSMIAQLEGELDRAMELVDEEEEIWRDLEDDISLARCLYTRGSLHWRRSEFRDALEAYGEAIPLLERAGHRRGLAHCLRMAGSTAERLDRLDEALAYCERALEIVDKLDDRRGIIGVSLSLADVYRSRDELDAAKSRAERALDVARELGDTRKVRVSYVTLGEIHLEAHEFQRAAEYLKESLELSEDGRTSWDVAYTHDILGDTRRHLGDLDAARENYRRSIATYEEICNYSAARDVKDKLEELDLTAGNCVEEVIMTLSYPAEVVVDNEGKTLEFEDGTTIYIRAGTLENREVEITFDRIEGQPADGADPVTKAIVLKNYTNPDTGDEYDSFDPTTEKDVTVVMPCSIGTPDETALTLQTSPVEIPDPDSWVPTSDEVDLVDSNELTFDLGTLRTFEVTEG